MFRGLIIGTHIYINLCIQGVPKQKVKNKIHNMNYKLLSRPYGKRYLMKFLLYEKILHEFECFFLLYDVNYTKFNNVKRPLKFL